MYSQSFYTIFAWNFLWDPWHFATLWQDNMLVLMQVSSLLRPSPLLSALLYETSCNCRKVYYLTIIIIVIIVVIIIFFTRALWAQKCQRIISPSLLLIQSQFKLCWTIQIVLQKEWNYLIKLLHSTFLCSSPRSTFNFQLDFQLHFWHTFALCHFWFHSNSQFRSHFQQELAGHEWKSSNDSLNLVPTFDTAH